MTSSGSSLQSKVAQRDQLLQVLQEETAQLLKNHSFALEEVLYMVIIKHIICMLTGE
jgi:hypothetical protein